MSHAELAKILDANMTVNIGTENHTNRVHWLFYSKADKMCFVAIQDVKSGTVVTVLPIDYHENICWAVSIEAQSKARELLIKADGPDKTDEPETLSPSVFRLSAQVGNPNGEFMKIINLGSWPRTPNESNITDLVQNADFIDELKERVAVKITTNETPPGSFVELISIRIGRKGSPAFFCVSDALNENGEYLQAFD